MISHLPGMVRAWATAEWARESPFCSSLRDFKDALCKVFDSVSSEQEKARQLSGLRQGRESVCDYTTGFQNSIALYDIFLKELAAPVKEWLLPLDRITDLGSSWPSREATSRSRTARSTSPLSPGPPTVRTAPLFSSCGRCGTHAAGQGPAHSGGTTTPPLVGAMLLLQGTRTPCVRNKQ